MTTFIVVGDPHIKTTNIPEFNLFLERLLILIEDRKPDFIVDLGDTLNDHERLHTTALNKAYEFIDKLRNLAPTYVLVGNHDATTNTIFLTDNHWLNGMKEWKNVVVVDTVRTLKVNNQLFMFCPYVPNGRFIEALDTCQEESWKKATCIFAHQEFYGCSMNAITSVEGDRWKESYPNVISGHIHAKQKLQSNIYYTGSAMQHAFGESTKNIIAVVTFGEKDTAAGAYDLEEVDLKLPRKKIVHTTVEDMDSYEVPEEEDKDSVKITISGVYEQFKSFKKTKKYKEIIKSGTKIVFKPKKIQTETKVELENEQESDFRVILSSLVNQAKDPYLYQTHEYIVNGKDISENDVLFLPEVK